MTFTSGRRVGWAAGIRVCQFEGCTQIPAPQHVQNATLFVGFELKHVNSISLVKTPSEKNILGGATKNHFSAAQRTR